MAAKIVQQDVAQQSSPDYLFTLRWEENFDFNGSLDWVNSNLHLPFLFALLFYLPVLYFGQIIMRNRDRLDVRSAMILWNGGLATFSIIGFIRVYPEMHYTLSEFGFHYTICNNSWIHVKPARFWIYLFFLSKIVEIGDTFFLVMRKRKLIFLHVYHHASVLIFSWFIYANAMGSSRWFSTMNFGVHSIMYSYYVLKAFPDVIKIPKWVSMLITALQTIQMLVGSCVVVASYYVKLSGQHCTTNTPLAMLGLFIYTSYLFLFAQFFYRAYCSPRTGNAVAASKKLA